MVWDDDELRREIEDEFGHWDAARDDLVEEQLAGRREWMQARQRERQRRWLRNHIESERARKRADWRRRAPVANARRRALRKDPARAPLVRAAERAAAARQYQVHRETILARKRARYWADVEASRARLRRRRECHTCGIG